MRASPQPNPIIPSDGRASGVGATTGVARATFSATGAASGAATSAAVGTSTNPPGVGSWAIDFTAKTLGASATFTGEVRASYNVNHYLAQGSTNAPRYHYPLPDAVCRGVLLEGPYTNFFDESDDLHLAPWGKTKCAVAKNQTGIDNAANSAVLLTGVAYAGSGIHKTYLQQSLEAGELGSVDTNVCLSAIVKKGTERYAHLRARTEGNNVIEVAFDLNFQTHSVLTGATYAKHTGIHYLGNLWYLLYLVFNGRQSLATTTMFGQVGIAPSMATLDWSPTGNDGLTLIVHTMDMVIGDYPVMPIRNVGVTTAKAGDILYYPTTTGGNGIAANNRDLFFDLFITRPPHGTDFKYLYRNGAESLRMNATHLRWYMDATNYLEAQIDFQYQGRYLVGLEKRSAGVSKLWVDGKAVATSSAAAFLANIATGSLWYLGSDGTGNHADIVYSAVEASAA